MIRADVCLCVPLDIHLGGVCVCCRFSLPRPARQAYKDSKVCNVLMMREMDKRFSSDGMVVSALFPGCIAESPLFREKRGWFRAGFPVFQKFITKQFVSTAVRNALYFILCLCIFLCAAQECIQR